MERRLWFAGWLFAVGSAVHLADHLRRGQGSVTDELYLLGNIGLIVQVAVITLVLVRHEVAPLAAAVFGPFLAVGFFAAHWLPEWSSISDPVWEITSLPALSYVASLLEILGALAVGISGLLVLRASGGYRPRRGARSAA